MRKWLLPEYIEDMLPVEARRVEFLRRALLDRFAAYGYELVQPPLLEYLDSLLTGTGHDLDLKTFKLVDQISGRTLGVRADITPQVARIDAHLLNRKGVSRLCYAGSILHTLPDGIHRTREPIQAGAEIYGHAGIEADLEIQRLMLDALRVAGIKDIQIDIGHVGVFRELVRHAKVDAEAEAELFRAVQAKDTPALRMLLKSSSKNPYRAALAALPELVGGVEVLAQAQRVLPKNAGIQHALAQLRTLATALRDDDVKVCLDLGELRGYRYHSGVVFAAYAAGFTDALALGGRYDEVGAAFGRARPATGFSLDLREVANAGSKPALTQRVLAPYAPNDNVLQKKIASLRKAGIAVVVDLPGHVGTRAELECERKLVKKAGKWALEKI